MRHNEDRIILAIAGLLLLVITVASLVDRLRPRRAGAGVEVRTGDHGSTGRPGTDLPEDWEERHTFYHLRGVPHSHSNDEEERMRAEAAWAEELQRRQAVRKNR